MGYVAAGALVCERGREPQVLCLGGVNSEKVERDGSLNDARTGDREVRG